MCRRNDVESFHLAIHGSSADTKFVRNGSDIPPMLAKYGTQGASFRDIDTKILTNHACYKGENFSLMRVALILGIELLRQGWRTVP